MGIDAIALIHCTDSAILARLSANPQLGPSFEEQLDALMDAAKSSAEDLPLAIPLKVFRVGRDWAQIFTGVRFHQLERDPLFARILATHVLENLPAGAHVDPRGMLFYPDAGELRATRYEAMVEDLPPTWWVSTAPIDIATRRAWQRAQIAKVT